jgi:hypothetical protein
MAIRFPVGAGNFSLHHRVQTGSGFQGLFSLGVKRPWREADHSPPYGVEVKNVWSHTFTPPIRLHDVHTGYEAFYPVLTMDSSLGVKRPVLEVDHSPLPSAVFKTAWIHASIPPIRLHATVIN